MGSDINPMKGEVETFEDLKDYFERDEIKEIEKKKPDVIVIGDRGMAGLGNIQREMFLKKLNKDAVIIACSDKNDQEKLRSLSLKRIDEMNMPELQEDFDVYRNTSFGVRMHRRGEAQNNEDRINSTKSIKEKRKCRLLSCDNMTDHNKGFCSSECFRGYKEGKRKNCKIKKIGFNKLKKIEGQPKKYNTFK